ncbi:MAG: murD [Planctomycetaceae bacterium]|nr:murD [Planctomycetaceae bacterium]
MELKNRRITVMGLGSFGGGLGAVQFLVEQGARVTVTDLRRADQLVDSIQELATTPPDAYHLGGHQAADFTDTDLLVVNPAVPRDCPFLNLAIQADVPLSSEMNLFWEFNRGRTLAVTGSNGKSTTTAMTHAILQATGKRCWLGGNIGRSLLPRVTEIEPEDWVVLELSSFQLEDLDRLRRSPEVSIITNFSANHLDRHLTLDNYRSAKQTILRWQSPDNFAVLNQDDADVCHWPTTGKRLYFGLSDLGNEGLFAVGTDTALFRFRGQVRHFPIQRWLTLPGVHNLQNALGAACAALAIQTPPEAVQNGLQGYQALPHRLELVADANGRQFYNDSLATTPESTIVALAAFDRPIILFAGGYDKGSDLVGMARAIADKPVKAVALMGKTGPRIQELLNQFAPRGVIGRHLCSNFDEAFEWAIRHSETGDVLLLSPGCASYDWFRNFADRGAQFRERAQKYTSQF